MAWNPNCASAEKSEAEREMVIKEMDEKHIVKVSKLVRQTMGEDG